MIDEYIFAGGSDIVALAVTWGETVEEQILSGGNSKTVVRIADT